MFVIYINDLPEICAAFLCMQTMLNYTNMFYKMRIKPTYKRQ